MNEKKVVKTLDCLWGCCDSLTNFMGHMLPSGDARFLTADEALTKAQTLILELMEEVK